MTTDLQSELVRRAAEGHKPSTLKAIKAKLAELGYRLDGSPEAAGYARYMTGPDAGSSYPTCCGPLITDKETGLSAFHVEGRRDARFKELQRIRFSEELFAVWRGRIFDL